MAGRTPHVLIILDGWGHRQETNANAIALANTPVWDNIWQNRPHTLISGSGLDVGLPEGQMGNSEVGHMNLGAGRVVDQDFTRITKAVEDKSFHTHPALMKLYEQLNASQSALHIFGLISPGGVHSHEDHIIAAIDSAAAANVGRIYVHGFLDGRDVPPKSATPTLTTLRNHFANSDINGGIASVTGRYFAMDRDNRWDRVAPAFDVLTKGKSDFIYADPIDALNAAYARGENDEFVQASAIKISDEIVQIDDGDAILFMNFRADRARELSRAFTETDFQGFDRGERPKISQFMTLTEYASDIKADVIYAPEDLTNSIGEYVANLGKTQLRIAETEKYAHVTFFFSGGRETPFEGEQRILIPSPNVATYDLQPEMSAPELTDKLCASIEGGEYDLIICNYANGDMVGHTGDLGAAIKAVECVDTSLQRIIESIEKSRGHCLITADHGNVEQMTDNSTGQAHTAHTSELVPLVYIGPKELTLTPGGGTLSDIAPTLLALMELPQPDEMGGTSLCQPTATR